MAYTKNLSALNKLDSASAGNKGAALGELLQHRIPVPPGFVVLNTAFERFLRANKLAAQINAILRRTIHTDPQSITFAAQSIQALILHAPLPDDVATDIQKNFKELSTRFVAVRSSAAAEDSAAASWAGQLESYLYTTTQTLLPNIQKCWASLFTPRALFYRIEQRKKFAPLAMAVIVQKMIQSNTAGVAFSLNPTTHRTDQIIIEAGWGLGEAVVAGKITPDHYSIEKKSTIIDERDIHPQNKKLVRAPLGGVREVFVARTRTNQQKLSDRKIIALSQLVSRIECHFGYPVDVEWAEEKGKFFITQSRPITILPAKIPLKPRTVFDYLKSQQWFFGVRTGESLLFYSAKRQGYDRYVIKEYGIPFAETLLLPLRTERPMRIFNADQARRFHARSQEKITKNPALLLRYINQDDATYEKIAQKSKQLLTAVQNAHPTQSIALFKNIMRLYEQASAHFIIIFSLGLKLTEHTIHSKRITEILHTHDRWRNSVAFKEETMGEALFFFFRLIAEQRKLDVRPRDMMDFATATELLTWVDCTTSNQTLQRIVALRKRQGFAYLHLHGKWPEVMDDPHELSLIRSYFSRLYHSQITAKQENTLTGQVAFSGVQKISGTVVVISDKDNLLSKAGAIKGKILVSVQTTPHFIPYIKNAKAIITDDGGITCHAAIIARELGIPCIVGTKTATTKLKDGDAVSLDMEHGIITVRKPRSSARAGKGALR